MSELIKARKRVIRSVIKAIKASMYLSAAGNLIIDREIEFWRDYILDIINLVAKVFPKEYFKRYYHFIFKKNFKTKKEEIDATTTFLENLFYDLIDETR